MNLTEKEQKVLDFAREKQGEEDSETMACKIQAVEILKSCKLGGDYISVALCHSLGKEGNDHEEELRALVGEDALNAIKIVNMKKNENLDITDFLDTVKKNKLANVAMIATLASMLHMAVDAAKEVQAELIYKAENYYLRFGLGSPGYLFIKDGYDALKSEYSLRER